MIHYGIISEIDYPNKLARVYIEASDIVTAWAVLPGALKSNRIFADKQQVAVIKDNEEWIILGEIPTDGSVPSWINDHTEGHEFSDGTKITYNTLTHTLTVSGVEEIVLNCNLKVNGTIKAGTVDLANHIHLAGTALISPSGPVTGTTGTPSLI